MATIQNGIITTDFGDYYQYDQSFIIQKNDKILVGVNRYGSWWDSYTSLARYNLDGSLDNSFDNDGKKTIGGLSLTLAIQQDGKVLVESNNELALRRYHLDGSADSTFNTISSGLFHNVDNYAPNLTIQQDGKVLIVGHSNGDFGLARYNVDGSLDTSFGSDGKVITDLFGWEYAYGVVVQQDNKILVSGTTIHNGYDYPALVRYNSNGSLDVSFGNNGKITSDYSGNGLSRIALQHDEKILVVGGYNNLNRYNIDGSVDKSFGNNGIIESDLDVHDVAVQTDDKILITGSDGTRSVLTRYNADGSLDTSFGNNGEVVASIYVPATALQEDGKILIAGYGGSYPNFEFYIYRYTSNGSLDDTFNDTPSFNRIITASGGYYSTFADLSKAAYQLASDENTGQGINYVKPYADEAWARVNQNWHVLTNADLSVSNNGLTELGIYHHDNAAAFAAQCENTLVLSFRGTNDNDADPAGLPYFDANTPDEIDWTDMGNTLTGHYGQFLEFIQAIDKYVADNGIQNVYVTGHSLGGAMVLGYMLDHKDSATVNYEAVTFAAPGYNMIGAPDARIVDVEMDGDIVHSFGYHQGHIVTINSDIKHSDTGLSYGKNLSAEYHSMDIYMEAAHALDSQLPDTSINTNSSIHGVNLTSFDSNWNAEIALPMSEAKGSQLAWDNSIAPRYEAMSGNNQLSGVGKNIMLGGVGDDDYRVDNQQDIIIEKADSGTDSVSSAVSLTLPENVENLTLQNKTGGISPFNFTQNLNGTGNAQNNILDGNDAKNILKGLGGNDLLEGGTGKDILIGGLGRDVLNGGAGADTFKFNAVNESSPTDKNRDVIIDFTSTDKDKIDLSAIDANITTTVNDTFLTLDLGINDRVFKLTNALYFNITTHILYGNNDADKAADFSILLSGITTLNKADFVL